MGVLTRTFFIFLINTLILSSVPEEVKIRLTGTEGGSITFPKRLDIGFLIFKGKTIASVKGRELDIWEDIYKDRLSWSSKTERFTLQRLQRNDSGVYFIDSKGGNRTSVPHELTVYEPVAAEVTKTESNKSCTFLCLVKKPEETTLTWYRGEELLNQSSWAPSLPLIVQREDFSSSYRCVAASPAEKKTLDVKCSKLNNTGGDADPSRYYYWIILPVVLTALVVLTFFISSRYFLKNKKTTTETQADSVESEPDVVYTTVKVPETRLRKGMNNPTSSGPDETSNLTTLYSQLELKHMKPDRSAEQTTNYPRA